MRESTDNEAELTELSRERYKGAELGAVREGQVAGKTKGGLKRCSRTSCDECIRKIKHALRKLDGLQ